MPMPVPQTRMPRSTSPAATACADLRRSRDSPPSRLDVGAEVLVGDAALVEHLLEMLLQLEARMVGAKRDAHRRRIVLYAARCQSVVVIAARASERAANAGHPWIYRIRRRPIRRPSPATSSTSSGPRGRAARLRRSTAIDQQIALRMLTPDDASGRRADFCARAPRGGDRVPRVAADRRHRLPARARRRRPAAVADRRSLRRRPRGADAVAGTDRRCRRSSPLLVELLRPAGILARNDPKVRALEGLDQEVTVVAGDVPEPVPSAKAASATRSILRTARRPGCSSISARTTRRRRATRAAGCSTLQLPRRLCAGAGAGCTDVLALDISADAVRAHPRQRRAQRRAQRRGAGGATSSTSCASSIGATSASTRSCSIRRRSRRTRRRAEGADRLQGDQPPRAAPAQPRRHPRHLHVLAPRRRRAVRRRRPCRRGGRRVPCRSSRSASRAAITRAARRPRNVYLKCLILRKLYRTTPESSGSCGG